MLDRTDRRTGEAGGGRARARADLIARIKPLVDVVWPWRWRAPLLAAAIVLAGLAIDRYLLGPRVSADAVVRADIVRSVVASGHVEAPFRVNIGSQITGVVTDVPVIEGQAVKAGDVLVVLDDRETKAAVVQAEGAMAQAEAKMRQLRELTLPSAQENMKQAKATLTNAQAAYDRAKHLADSGSGTRATLDEATKSLDVAKALLRNAEFQVFTNSPGGSDFVIAETQLRQAAAGLSTAHSRLAYTVIKAPRDGVLISRDVEKGNVVQPSNVLMKLSPTGETQLVVQVDEKNLGLISVGQKALASADAYAPQSFPAEVVYINPGVDLQRASVEVKLRVPEPPAYLKQDMTVSVDIETQRAANSLVVPTASVRASNTRGPWVLKEAKGRAVRQQVKTGIVAGTKTQVLDGLAEGDLVIPPSQTAAKAGSSVQARVPDRPEITDRGSAAATPWKK